MLPTPQERLSAKSAPREGIPTFKEILNATSATGVLLQRMARWNAVPAPQAMAQTLTILLASNAQQGSTAMMAMVAGIAGAAISQKRDLQRRAVTHVQLENTCRIVIPQVDMDLDLDRDLHTHIPMDPHTDVFYTEPVHRLAPPRRNVLTAREAGTATQGPPIVTRAGQELQRPMAVQHVLNAALAHMPATKPVNAPTVVRGPFPTQGPITASVVAGALFHLKVMQAAQRALWVSMQMKT